MTGLVSSQAPVLARRYGHLLKSSYPVANAWGCLSLSITKTREGQYLCSSAVFSTQLFVFTDSDALWSEAEAGTSVRWNPGDNYRQQPQCRQPCHRDLWTTTLPLLQVQTSPSYCMCLSLKDVSNYGQETSAAQTPCTSSAPFACAHVYSATGLFHSAPHTTLLCMFWGGTIGFMWLFWLVFDVLFSMDPCQIALQFCTVPCYATCSGSKSFKRFIFMSLL